jgi:hypothetical protein
MMKLMGGVFVVCVAAAALVFGQAEKGKGPAGGTTVAGPATPIPGAEPLAEWRNWRLTPHGRLRQELPARRFEAVTLTVAIDALRQATSAPIVVNWTALEATGIKRDTPITLELPAMSFGQALQHLLDEAAGAAGTLGYRAGRKELVISTKADLALGEHARARVYEVRELVRPKEGMGAATEAERLAAVRKMITGSVDPTTWRDRGGTLGDIREGNGQLIITQTPANHRAITNLLNQARFLLGLQPLPEQPPPQPAPPRGPRVEGEA